LAGGKMTQNINPKGSVIYKILIVLLAVGLVASILYPKHLWKQEELRTQQCRNNMEHILYTELVYLSQTNTYTDTLEKVIQLIENDTTGKLLRNFVNNDSVLAAQVIDHLKKYEPAKTIIDSLSHFGYKMSIDTTDALILDSLRTYADYSRYIDSIAVYALNNYANCPTVNRPYKLSIVDTSAITYLNIACPIDSLDSLAVARNFLLSKIGGLTIKNHGKIENFEKSWKK
jgi:hypothetical protein